MDLAVIVVKGTLCCYVHASHLFGISSRFAIGYSSFWNFEILDIELEPCDTSRIACVNCISNMLSFRDD